MFVNGVPIESTCLGHNKNIVECAVCHRKIKWSSAMNYEFCFNDISHNIDLVRLRRNRDYMKNNTFLCVFKVNYILFYIT